MYELYPYFTNDGTVGLFSPIDDDIYHSTHGALTESWQKFILPANFKEYIETHDSIKVLDICYGIGYNTKTALNVFVENRLNDIKFQKKTDGKAHKVAAIDTDNIGAEFNETKVEILSKKKSNLKEKLHSKHWSNAPIYTDNISGEKLNL